MTKQDLRSGMRVTVRCGNQFIVMVNPECPDRDMIPLDAEGHMPFCKYTEELKCNSGMCNDRDYDIVKVESCDKKMSFLFTQYDTIKWKTIWEREEKEIAMTDIEAKFGCKVKIVDR